MDTPSPQPATPWFKPMTLALACAGLALAPSLATFTALNPGYGVWNASVIGALALFTGARLGFWQGVLFTAAAIALKDVSLYLTTPWWEPYTPAWAYFTGYAVVGWAFLRHSTSLARPVVAGFACGLPFFLISNFTSWYEKALPYYEDSLQGLLDCYIAGIPFHRGTLIGDVGFTVALFGAHALLSRAFFPLERVQLQEIEDRSDRV